MSWRSDWKTSEHGPNRMPLVFLAYLIFCFIAPVQNHAGWEKWLATIGGVLCFLALYLTAYLTKGPLARWSILGIVILVRKLNKAYEILGTKNNWTYGQVFLVRVAAILNTRN